MNKQSQLKIEKVKRENLDDLFSHLKTLDLPLDGVKDHLNNFFVLLDNSQIIGSIGLEIYGEVGLIRSVGIVKSYQGLGLGQRLVENIEKYAIDQLLKEIYIFTDTAEEFFNKYFGFKNISIDKVDPRIKQSREYTMCEDSTTMIKFIDEN